MIEEIKIMRASHEFEISRIKSQMLADIAVKITEKYDYVTDFDIEEIARKARMIVASVFGIELEEKGGE